MELKDQVRRIAPEDLRVKAGFAKTHGRPAIARPTDIKGEK